jgi:hypothetical protein
MRKRHYLAVSLLLLYSIVLGLFATHLSKLYYSNYGPFFDSIGYLSSLAQIIERSLFLCPEKR